MALKMREKKKHIQLFESLIEYAANPTAIL